MSLRIKLPAKSASSASPSQSSEQTHRPKSTKRIVTVTSDDEEEEDHEFEKNLADENSPARKRNDIVSLHGDDDAAQLDTEAKPIQRLSSRSTKGKAKPRLGFETSAPARKKVKATTIESDWEGDHRAHHSSENEEFDDGREKSLNKVKAKERPRLRKRKTSVIEAEEEQGLPSPHVKSSIGKRLRGTINTNDDDSMIDVVGESSTTSNFDSPAQTTEDAPAPPKKRKLPTIKKNKNLTATTTSTTNIKASVLADPTQLGLPDSNKPPTVRKPAAVVGVADLDLSNASIYAEIFKNPGGTSARTSSNRRVKDEERRKELDKMRDEARAKRDLEAGNTFDLQGQMDKIARFEEKLRSLHSSAVFPNFMAAKWREQYERKRQKERENRMNSRNGQEDGEMADM